MKEDETGDAGDAELVGDAAVSRGVDGADFEERKGARKGVDVRRHAHGEPAVRRKDQHEHAVALLRLPVFQCVRDAALQGGGGRRKEE